MRSSEPQRVGVGWRGGETRERRLLSTGEYGHEAQIFTDRTPLARPLRSAQMPQARSTLGKRSVPIRQSDPRDLALGESLNARRVENAFHS